MLPGELDITIYRGDPYERTYTHYASDGTTVIPLTGYTAKWSIKDKIDGTIIIEYDSETDSELVVNEGLGKIILEMPQTITTDFDFAKAVWEFAIYNSSGKSQTLGRGNVYLKRDVIR